MGDWASPLLVSLPTTPYFGIEGTPSTGALAIANMRTSIEHHLLAGHSVAPAVLLPFTLITMSDVEKVRKSGGVCFGYNRENLGGQGVGSVESQTCLPFLIAGGTSMSHALQSVAQLQTCPGKQDWPRIFIAKFDIEGYEFKALSSALEWLAARPPCYIIIEIRPTPRTTAIHELLLDLGYDSVWRTHRLHTHTEFPPGPPFWSRSRNHSTTLHQGAEADLGTDPQAWKEYLYGFENQEMCLRRLVN